MLPKKNHKLDLEKRKAIHIQVGLIIALSFVLVSLEWGTISATSEAGVFYIPDFDPMIEIQQSTIRKPPKEVKKIPQLLIPIPVDDEFLDEEFDLSDLFDSENLGQEWDFESYYGQVEARVPEPIDQNIVQFKPEFPGGEIAMMKWLYSNIKYPQECIEYDVEGKVIAKFVISKFGEVTGIEIIRKVHPLLDAEVVRVLNIMPDFRPAMQGTTLVPVYMNIPVVFDLR